MSIQQRPRDRADDQARADARKRDQPGEGGGVEPVEGEQHDRDAEHAAADPAERHSQQDPSDRRDPEQLAIRGWCFGMGHREDAIRRRRPSARRPGQDRWRCHPSAGWWPGPFDGSAAPAPRSVCPANESRAPKDESPDRSQADPGQGRDRGLRRPRRQDQLEERNGIAPFGLQRPDRTVAVPDDERGSLADQEGDAGPDLVCPPARCHAGPDVAEAAELCHRPRSVGDAPGLGAWWQRLPRHQTIVPNRDLPPRPTRTLPGPRRDESPDRRTGEKGTCGGLALPQTACSAPSLSS